MGATAKTNGTAIPESGCSLCGSQGGQYWIYSTKGWDYFRCPQCGVICLKPMPNDDELRGYYNEAYSVVAEANARGTERNAPPILQSLSKRFPERGKLLEVGCSYGYFLQAARTDGWQVTGIELDGNAAKYGNEQLGVKVFSGTLDTELHRLEPPFDAIVSFHVIEHLRGPMEFLQCCRALLRDNGALVLKTPNVSSWIAKRVGAYWSWLSPPAHIYLFSPSTLHFALHQSGFKIERIWSRRGDANNDLFELLYAFGKYVATRNSPAIHAEAGGHGQKGWLDRWQVKAVRAVSETLYHPVEPLLDSLLGRRGLQPELVVIARNEN